MLSGTLPDPRGKTCDAIPIVEFQLGSPYRGRFLKFTAINYYGIFSALQYIAWE